LLNFKVPSNSTFSVLSDPLHFAFHASPPPMTKNCSPYQKVSIISPHSCEIKKNWDILYECIKRQKERER
jgi:hypothetical protein